MGMMIDLRAQLRDERCMVMHDAATSCSGVGDTEAIASQNTCVRSIQSTSLYDMAS